MSKALAEKRRVDVKGEVIAFGAFLGAMGIVLLAGGSRKYAAILILGYIIGRVAYTLLIGIRAALRARKHT